MSNLAGHIGEWWRALTNPRFAREIVLDEEGKRGFLRFVIVGTIILYAAYGFSMGVFRGFVPGLVTALKMPMLYLLAL